MSRRYGRNQKRRDREALAASTAEAKNYREAWERECALLEYVRTEKEKLRETVSRIAGHLGPRFVGLPPRQLEGATYAMERDSFRMSTPYGGAVEMTAMVMETRRHSTEPQDKVHFVVKMGGEYVAYALSWPAIWDCKDHRLLACQMAEQMAPMLLKRLLEVA